MDSSEREDGNERDGGGLLDLFPSFLQVIPRKLAWLYLQCIVLEESQVVA
jgi:hypothetical protein